MLYVSKLLYSMRWLVFSRNT